MGYGVWGVPGWVVFGVLYSKFLVRGMMNTEHRTPNVEVLVISLGHPGACAGKYAANTPFTPHPSPIPFTLSQAYSSIGGQVQTRFLSP